MAGSIILILQRQKRSLNLDTSKTSCRVSMGDLMSYSMQTYSMQALLGKSWFVPKKEGLSIPLAKARL